MTMVAQANARKSAFAAIWVGAGLMAAIDEIAFHQLLGWHHFYDRSTPAMGLLADGLLHAGELIALVAGGAWILHLQRENVFSNAWGWAGLFLGLGFFQLLDGLFIHKVLRLHQIRDGVVILPYDVAWISFGVLLLIIGGVLTAIMCCA